MLQHAATVLQQLLPVWGSIAPDWQNTASAIGSSSSSSDDGSSFSSLSDAGSSIEDEAMPSLKEIAAHHQLMAARSLQPNTWALLAVMPSISSLLEQQGRDTALDHFTEEVRKAVSVVFSVQLRDPKLPNQALFRACSIAIGFASIGRQDLQLGAEEDAALACLVELPFAYSDVLQVAAGSSTPAAAAAALAPSTPAVDAAGPCQDTGTSSSKHQSSSSAHAGSRSPTPAASLQQRSTSVHQQPSPRSIGSSSSSRSWGCHYAGCANLCGVSELVMPVYGCSGCHSAGFSYACTYCSSACQQADWPVHKQACRQVRRQSSKGPQQQ
jgi:hypothetical protein